MDQHIAFEQFLPYRLPRLAAHLVDKEFPLTLIGVRWFLCLFAADMAEVAGFQPGGREEAKLVLSRPACMALWAAGGRKGALARLMADMGGLR